MSDNKILKLGLSEAECFNCSKNLSVGKESEYELRIFNKIYYRYPSCEYFLKYTSLLAARF